MRRLVMLQVLAYFAESTVYVTAYYADFEVTLRAHADVRAQHCPAVCAAGGTGV